MERNERIRKIINELFNDNREHSLDDIRNRCNELSVAYGRNTIHNVVHSMKTEGILQSTRKRGQYIKGDKYLSENKDNKTDCKHIDENDFFVLKPQNSRFYEMWLKITEKGVIQLNSSLRKEIDSREIELKFRKDYKEILLSNKGSDVHHFTKAGIARNTRIVRMLKEAELSFPVEYRVNWDEYNKIWIGRMKEIDEKQAIAAKERE